MRACQCVKLFLHCQSSSSSEADLHKSEFYQLENWPINIFNMRISHKLNRTGETPRSPCPHYRIAPVKWHVMIYLPPFPHMLSLFMPPSSPSSVCLTASQCKSQSRPQSRSLSRTQPPASEHLGEGHRETIDVSCGGCGANCDCSSDCD